MPRPAGRRGFRQRKCHCCGMLYTPDPRNRRHQKYCSQQACRSASKKASQQQWLSSDKGADYFQGSHNVYRVQQWRALHPGYWKRRGNKSSDALQDVLSVQPAQDQGVSGTLTLSALQDVCLVQPALFIGLIASLTGSTLQDDIAQTTRRLIDSGRNILGSVPEP